LVDLLIGFFLISGLKKFAKTPNKSLCDLWQKIKNENKK
jgi:hypothetical protein